MSIKRNLIVTTAALSLLGLTACGSTEEASTTEAPASSESAATAETTTEAPTEESAADLPTSEPTEGETYMAYTTELDGTTYYVDLEATEGGDTWAAYGYQAPVIITLDSEAPEGVEEYREATGTDEVAYVRVDADNREGIAPVDISDLEVYDTDGNTYSFESAFIPVGDWGPQWTGEYNDANEYEMADGTWMPEEEYTELSNQGTDVYNELLDSDVPVKAKGSFYLIGDPIPEGTTLTGMTAVDAMEYVPAFPAEPLD